MNVKSLVVPLDGSTFAEAALPFALSVARRLETRVQLVSVYEDEPRVGGWLISAAGAKEWFEGYHWEVRERIVAVSDVPVSTAVVRGPMPKALVGYVEQQRCELVAMTTHGRGTLSRAWLGSVADHVMRHVTMPVLLVRPSDAAPKEGEQQLVEAEPFAQILVPLDGSKAAEQSVKWALRLGHDRCATYTMVRAVPPLFALTTAYLPHAIQETKQFLEQGRKESETYLADLRERLRGEDLEVRTEVLVGVQPGWGIVRYADEQEMDLIVIATHGRGGVPRLILGSVADKVVRGSHVPVLVHRPPTS